MQFIFFTCEMPYSVLNMYVICTFKLFRPQGHTFSGGLACPGKNGTTSKYIAFVVDCGNFKVMPCCLTN